MIRTRSLLLALILLMTWVTPTYAQPTPDTCKTQIADRMQLLQYEYRRVVFGSTGSSLFDGKAAVLKTGGVFSGGTVYDYRDIPGIFGTKHRMTSELIDPATESYRVFRCKLLNMCDAVTQNIHGQPGQVHHLGCPIESVEYFDQCDFSDENTQVDAQDVIEFCATAVADTLQAEKQALKLAVAYDSGYRSLVQVAGMFDFFLKEFAKSAFLPMQQMVALLGKLHQIPCFLPHCDLPPDSVLDPPE